MDFEIDMTKVTLNGHFYSSEVLEKAIAAYQVHIEKKVSLGTVGIPDYAEPGLKIDVSQVSHMITKLSVEDGIIKGQFKFMGPQMVMAEQLYQNNIITLVPNGYGHIENKKVTDYVLHSISFTNNSAISK